MMKKQIACPNCKGNGFLSIITGDRNDYCGIGSEMCSVCGGTGMQEADMTNAERIRAMTDKELVEFIGHYGLCDRVQGDGCWCDEHAVCEGCLEEWLKQPWEVEDA